MTALERVAARHNLAIVEDCCQAHLATADGRPVGTIGVAGAFSFYPTKNLGALGDGGAVVTNDRALAERVKRLRNGGQTDRYHHEEAGVNSRLDEMQAAILRARLPLPARVDRRRRALAARYRRRLAGAPVDVPPSSMPVTSIICSSSATRGAAPRCRRICAARGIETLIHYPIPIPRQPALAPAIRPTARRRSRRATRCCRCRCIPGCATTMSTTIARRAVRRVLKKD